MDARSVRSELVFEPSPAIGSSHAATIVERADGDLLCAWFAGTHEGHADVAIWLAHHDGVRWQAPVKVADVPGVPLWNPVLYRDAKDGLWLFYKAGPTVPSWTGLVLRSDDGGLSWSGPTLLPAGLLGPARNKPVTLSNGDILCPTSHETWQNWACWVELSRDGGVSWAKVGPIVAPEDEAAPSLGDTAQSHNDPISVVWDTESQTLLLPQHHRGVIQPTVWEFAPGRLRMLMRATRRVGAVCVADSNDFGRTWSPARALDIPHPNSGLDAARLPDGRIVLVCNPVLEGRTPLSLLVSDDNGETWGQRFDLETAPGEYSYPSVIATENGVIHIVYTYDRKSIKHVAVDM